MISPLIKSIVESILRLFKSVSTVVPINFVEERIIEPAINKTIDAIAIDTIISIRVKPCLFFLITIASLFFYTTLPK